MVTRNDAYSVVRSNTIGPRVCVACSPAFGACAAPAWWSSDCHNLKYFRFRAERRCFWPLEVRVLGCTYLRGPSVGSPWPIGVSRQALSVDSEGTFGSLSPVQGLQLVPSSPVQSRPVPSEPSPVQSAGWQSRLPSLFNGQASPSPTGPLRRSPVSTEVSLRSLSASTQAWPRRHRIAHGRAGTRLKLTVPRRQQSRLVALRVLIMVLDSGRILASLTVTVTVSQWENA